MATTEHYLWASGHFLLLFSFLRYFSQWIMFKQTGLWWYKASYVGALLSYIIVCRKSLGNPQLSAGYIKRALMDENVQYLIVAFFWWTSKPIAITLIPYAIFSLFHALTFTRTTLMPQFLPPKPPTQPGGPPTPHPLAKRLQQWVKANYDSAMRAVAFAELIIMVRVLLGALTFQNSLLSPVVYAHFLRQRYYQSAFTREAVATAVRRIDGYVIGFQKPVVTDVWTKAKALISRWSGTTLEQQAPRPQGQ